MAQVLQLAYPGFLVFIRNLLSASFQHFGLLVMNLTAAALQHFGLVRINLEAAALVCVGSLVINVVATALLHFGYVDMNLKTACVGLLIINLEVACVGLLGINQETAILLHFELLTLNLEALVRQFCGVYAMILVAATLQHFALLVINLEPRDQAEFGMFVTKVGTEWVGLLIILAYYLYPEDLEVTSLHHVGLTVINNVPAAREFFESVFIMNLTAHQRFEALVLNLVLTVLAQLLLALILEPAALPHFGLLAINLIVVSAFGKFRFLVFNITAPDPQHFIEFVLNSRIGKSLMSSVPEFLAQWELPAPPGITLNGDWHHDFRNTLTEFLQLVLTNALFLASFHKNPCFCNWVINMGACVDGVPGKQIYPGTPLHNASAHGNIETAKLLLVRGANVNSSLENGVTPLHLSSTMGHRGVSHLLIEWGADVCATTSSGVTPLHMCSQYGHKEGVDLLLSRGPEVDSVTESGATAIHYACQEGHLDVVKALANRKARADTVAVNGGTPLYSACANGRWDVVRLLIKRYGPAIVEHTTRQLQNDITPLICLTIRQGAPLAILKLLFANGASVHDSELHGSSSLHYACIFGSFETIKFIHSKGVRWDVVNDDGLNPVHCAMKRRDVDFQVKIKELLGTERFSRLEKMDVTPRLDRLHFHFKDVTEIGSGSFGQVFRGRWKKNDEWYAIKRLKPREQFTVENIKQEFDWLSSRARSPFITSPWWYWWGKHGNSSTFYIVMEKCDCDLHKWMTNNPCGKRDRREVLQYVSDIAAGLRLLHHYDRGLIHRDLAPRNILLKRNVVIGSDPPRTVAKISDLGLASDKTSAATGEQFPLHSSGWNRPEPFPPPELPSIVTSTPTNYNESVDIYNAAMIFHQLLAFKRAQATQPNKLTDDFKKQQPQDITSFLERMLHESKEKRPNAYKVERATKKWLADYYKQRFLVLLDSILTQSISSRRRARRYCGFCRMANA